MVQRHVSFFVDFLIVQNVMTMTKRASFDVLTAQTNVNTFFQQRTERENFAQRPIGNSIMYHFLALFQRSHQTRVNGVIFRNWAKRRTYVIQSSFVDARIRNSQRIAVFKEIYKFLI